LIERIVIDRVVIVGAGECGARAAVGLREQGYAGSVVLIGDEPHAPYERPPLSKAALTGADEPVPTTICGPDRLDELGIEPLCEVLVTGLDRPAGAVVLDDGRSVPYDRLVLALGSRPRPLPVEGGELAVTLRTFDDAVRLRAMLAAGGQLGVVGGGFIGLEVAAAARAHGCEVTVIEIAPRVLGRVVPAPLADVIAARHAEEGVTVRCGVGIERVEQLDARRRIVLTDGTAVDCDLVLAGIGAVPNVELAAEAGLVIDNGIAVDAQLRTSDPAIYAAGDCCSFPHGAFGGRRLRLEAWRNAQDQADHAVVNLLGADAPYDVIPWFWTDQYDLGLQIAGLPDAATSDVVRPRADGVALHFGLDDDGRLVSASGVAEGTRVAKDIRLAELLIGQRAHPDPRALADPSVNLKGLLSR
jgi:3-phenylpropionate/trans-cinnamate dioxygenase ferredoxin reductase subunit